MMGRKQLFVVLSLLLIGMILLVGGIWSAFSLRSRTDRGTLDARALDNVFGSGGSSGGGVKPDPCRSVLSVEVVPAQRVMSDSDTQVLTVTLINHDKTLICDEDVGFYAPEFDFTPASPLERHLTIPPGEKRSLSWIIEPRRQGTFEIGVSLDPLGIEPIVGITVTNVFGLTIWQAQLLSYLSSFLGAFFGPVLSFTWWYRIWKKHRRKKAAPALSSIGSSTLSERVPTGPIGKLLTKKRDNNITHP
jgi:hypothetical protein